MSNDGADSTAYLQQQREYDEHKKQLSLPSSSTPVVSTVDDDEKARFMRFYDMFIATESAGRSRVPAGSEKHGNNEKHGNKQRTPLPSETHGNTAGSDPLVNLSTRKLLAGVSSFTGMPAVTLTSAGAATITPGGAAMASSSGNNVNDNRDNDNTGGDDDVFAPPPPPHPRAAASIHAAASADLVWRHIVVRGANRIARQCDATAVLGYGSASRRAHDIAVRCRDARNRYEVEALSTIIDCLREGAYDMAMELAYRRLAGVEAADKTDGKRGAWTVATVLDVSRPSELFDIDMQRALERDVQRYNAVHNINKQPSATVPGTGGQWHGNNGRSKRRGRGGGKGSSNSTGGGKDGGGAGGAAAKS
jgi:hypothetical protein